MRSFTDNIGRAWSLVVNVATIKRVRALVDFDINGVVEITSDGKPDVGQLERLQRDPVLLVDVLYAVCKPDADARGVTDEDFGRAMAGDAIEAATNALLDEIIDFFPTPKRLAFRKIMTASQRVQNKAQERLKEMMEAPEFEEKLVSELEQLTGLSTIAPESAESTQTP